MTDLPESHLHPLSESELIALELSAMGMVCSYEYDSPVVKKLVDRGLMTEDTGHNPPLVALRITNDGRQALELHKALHDDE